MTEETLNGSLEPYTPPSLYPGWHMPEAHTLPSGAIFWLRKPQIRRLIQRGQIPNPLMEIINSVFETRDQAELAAEAEAKGLTEEELLEQRRLEAEAAAEDPEKPPAIPNVEATMTPEMALSFRDVVVWATIVEPKVEIAPAVSGPLTASGALSYDALDEDDIRYIIRFANGELEEVATFPADDERQDSGADRGEVRDETEPVAGHPA